MSTILRLIWPVALAGFSLNTLAEDYYLTRFEKTIPQSEFQSTTFFHDDSMIPGKILRDMNHGQRVGDDDEATHWVREVIYYGTSNEPGMRINHTYVKIAFGESFFPGPKDVVFNLDLESSQVRWPRSGVAFIRLDLPDDIYSQVLELAKNGKSNQMRIDVSIETDSGLRMDVYTSGASEPIPYRSVVDLFKDHFQRTHWLGMDAVALRMFRGPRMAMLSERVQYANRKCAELLENFK